MPSKVEKVLEEDYTDTLSSSYLNYSMSVLVDRAVPDIRDGLKPVQRRVLYDMYRMGATHDKPYKKTARVSGDVIGKLHPHGSSGVETAIVTMTQPFKKPVPFIDGQGNWGSVEGDEAAAARYTECKLTEFSEECFLSFVDDDTVDFQPNYDETMEEPVVLPSLVPTVLITGAEGIAVGMRTNIPTFNLSEVIDANVYVLNHSNESEKTYLRQVSACIPGPDFVSGGVVCNADELAPLYTTGECKIRVRGKVHYEPATKESKARLVVDEVPYTMVGSAVVSFMQNVVELIESKQLQGVVDVIDQTSEKVRVVLELSKDADVEYVKNTLFAKTKLEDTFSANVLVVCDGIPQTIGLIELLKRFSEFQKEVFFKKYQHDLNKYTDRSEVLSAYVTCSKNAKKVVEVIQSSKTTTEARNKLAKEFSFTDSQCDAVMSLRMSRLVSMESDKILNELELVNKLADECRDVLSSDKKLVSKIVSTIKKLKRKYGYERRTELVDEPAAQYVEITKEAKNVGVLIDRFSYVHQIDMSTYERYMETVFTEFPFGCVAKDNEKVTIFSTSGTMYRVKVSDVPKGGLRHKGVPLDNVTRSKFNSRVESTMCVVPDSMSVELLVVTAHGRAKIVNSTDCQVSRTACSYVTLDEGEQVVSVVSLENVKSVDVVTTDNRYVRVDVGEVPKMSRTGKGRKLVQRKSPSVLVDFVVGSKSNDNCSPIGSLGVKLTQQQINEVKKLYHGSVSS